MLVLSRQRDETIMIGDDIEITVVDIRGDKVRLGITAPNRIAVHRKEVYDAITRENEQAARISGGDLQEIAQKIRPGPARSSARAKAARLSAGSSNGQHPAAPESSDDANPSQSRSIRGAG